MRRSPARRMSTTLPKQRRQWTELRSRNGRVELWWTPPAHVGLHDVTNFRTTRSLGEVTGVFDCEYTDCDEAMLSNEELRNMITYEVEVELSDKESAVFFGFKGKDNIRFNVSAESLWDLTEGKALGRFRWTC